MTIQESGTPKEPSTGSRQVRYLVTLLMALGATVGPYAFYKYSQRTLGETPTTEWLAAATAGVVIWSATAMGLTMCIRFFGSIAAGTAAAVVGGPVLSSMLFEIRPGQELPYLPFAVSTAIIGGVGLVVFFLLGAFLRPLQEALKKNRAARAIDFGLGLAFGIACFFGLSFLYGKAFDYTDFVSTRIQDQFK